MMEKLKEKYFEALEEVVDPELGIDIVNLGLVYGIEKDDEGVIQVRMTLTSMGCPMAPQIMAQVEDKLMQFDEVDKVNVELVWEPQWSKSMMTRYGKIALGIHE